MSVIGMISAASAKKGLEKVVEDIYSMSKAKVGKCAKRWKAKNNIDKLYIKLKSIRMVKTILQPEKAVDLLRFYYPTRLMIGKKRVEVNDVDDLEFEGNIVIKGAVGQGKSIFFRYLASREIVKGKSLPLFAELRRIGENEALVDHLIEEAKDLGLDGLDKDTFLWLLEHGKVILLLDGFDEVPEIQRTRLITDIECLVKRHDLIRILISSRPNSGIETSSFFRVLEIASLEETEYEDVLKKIAGKYVSDQIIKAVRKSPTSLSELLNSPLMTALLIVRYRIEQTVPENVIGFYNGLFNLLISRHDRMKGMYKRPRKSGLGDTALEEVFDALCFLTKRDERGSLTTRELAKYANQAIKLTGHVCDPDTLIGDIMDITGLILEEGDECRFIHKSVQEYHAACFIKDQPEEVSRKFYEYAIDNWMKWSGELEFLSMLDKYRFMKWFLIPDMRRIIGLEESDVPSRLEIKEERIRELFKRTAVFVGAESMRCRQFSYGPMPYTIQVLLEPYPVESIFAFSEWSRIVELFPDKVSTLDKKYKAAFIIEEDDTYVISGEDLVKIDLVRETLRCDAEVVLEEVRKKLIRAESFVKEIEARKSVFQRLPKKGDDANDCGTKEVLEGKK